MKTKLLAIVWVIALFAMDDIASAQNLLYNGDFSIAGAVAHDADGWGEYNTTSSSGGWVNRETQLITQNPPYGDVNNFHYSMGYWGTYNANVSQDVTVPDTGLTYELSADASLDAWWMNTGFLRLEFYNASSTLIGEVDSDPWTQPANDVGVPWANYSVTGTAPPGTVLISVILRSTGAGGTARFDNAQLSVYDPISDTDEDGLPNWWEIDNGLDPYDDGTTNINNGASGDPDSDTLLNSDEFALGTNPQVADTDGDGLNDADEVTNLTDPLDADSDDDFLSDGDEVNIHGTNPLLADTDSDDVNDATEVYAGSNPNLLASVPANARPDVIGIESFYYNNGVFGSKAGGELFDYDNTTSTDAYIGHTGAASAWSANWNTPYITAGRLETRDSAMIRPLNGKATGGEDIALFAQQAVSPEVDAEVLYAKVEMTLDAGVVWGGLTLFGAGEEEIFFGVGVDDSGTNIVYKMEERYVLTNVSAIATTPNQTYTMVIAMDANAQEISLWVDPVLSSPEPVADFTMSSITATNLRCSAVRLGSGGSGSAYWDNLVVGKTWESLSAGNSDSDSDGLPDAWENNYGLDPLDDGTTSVTNGASGDPDSDTLVNSDELAIGTDPTLADTDFDGLADAEEVTASTDPLVWDTDGDGLNDGDEVNIHGTNPLLVDSDYDDEDDWFEVFQGTDPTDILSTSASEGVAVVDGTLDAFYGAARAVQTVKTAGNDNLDELDAAYAYVKNGRLFLMITGNMNTNWNSLEIFIDSSDAVTTNVFTAQGRDNTAIHMDGLVFDEGFSPDYHLYARIGRWAGRAPGFSFNLDFADLGATTVSYQDDAFSDSIEGIRYMGPGDAASKIVAIGFNNSNVAGVVSDGIGGAANQTAALDVTTGLELSIDLADLGNPAGEIRIMAMMTTDDHATISNQILPGPTPGQAALGTTTNVNFSALAGDQFFTVNIPLAVSPEILAGQLISGNTLFQLNVHQLVVGLDYKIQETADLTTAFSDVPGSDWTASSTNEVVTVPTDTVANPVMFYQVIAP